MFTARYTEGAIMPTIITAPYVNFIYSMKQHNIESCLKSKYDYITVHTKSQQGWLNPAHSPTLPLPDSGVAIQVPSGAYAPRQQNT